MNLTKKQAILILLSTLFFSITSSAVYLLTPYEDENIEGPTSQNSQIINPEEDNDKDKNKFSIKTSNNVQIEDIKLFNSNSTISAKVTIPSEDIYLGAQQIFSKINNKKIKNPKIELFNGYFKMSAEYKIVGGFYTSVVASVKPTIKDNKLYLSIPNVSVGKIQLNDKFIDFILKKSLKDIKHEISYKNATITFDMHTISPQLGIDNFVLNENNLSAVLSYSLDKSLFNK